MGLLERFGIRICQILYIDNDRDALFFSTDLGISLLDCFVDNYVTYAVTSHFLRSGETHRGHRQLLNSTYLMMKDGVQLRGKYRLYLWELKHGNHWVHSEKSARMLLQDDKLGRQV